MEKRKIGIERELSWLQFNERVLQEAQDMRNPLLEQLRFLGIFSNNLDEFFKVRFATLRRELKSLRKSNISAASIQKKQLEQIHDRVIDLQILFDKTFENTKANLALQGIHFKSENQITKVQKEFLQSYFEENIRHHIIPIILKTKGNIPPLKDNELYLIVDIVSKTKQKVHALIEVPTAISRFVILPSEDGSIDVILLEDVIRLSLRKIFSVFKVQSARAFDIKVVRDAEYHLEQDYSKSVFDKISKSIQQRDKGEYVRLNFDRKLPKELLDFLLLKTKIKDAENIIPGGRYHNKKDFMKIPSFNRPDLNFPPSPPLTHAVLEKSHNILDTVAKQDILLHYPYQKFAHVLDMLRAAAIDPLVRTIRITMYRIASDSHILHALVNAAKNGKRVVAIVEVQARFDEEHNIEITRILQEAGVEVIPGVPGLKVHCKIFQISRKINGVTERITHIGTGNFHEKTANVYSDTTLLTAHLEIGREVRKLFEFFESNYNRPQFRHLLVSPFNTRRKLNELIQKEMNHAKKGKPASILIKLNNLIDDSIIKKLLDAAEAGVKITCIIRGVCLLVPTTKKQEKNIQLRSIIGRYLEHSRVLVFHNNGDETMLIGSADLMTRNLDYRVEVLTPIYDKKLQQEISEWLNMQLSDHAKARSLKKEDMNEYIYPLDAENSFDTQIAWKKYLEAKSVKA
jgi:polyphosphate kinase